MSRDDEFRRYFESLPFDERERLSVTAFHEAGHAVAARHLGFEVEYVTIEPAGDTAGHCYVITRCLTGYKAAELAEAIVVQTMAGPLAQAKFMHDPTSDGSDGDDRRMIALWLPMCGRSRRDLAEEALTLVQSHWAATHDVAVRLLCKGRLEKRELDEIIAHFR